MFSLCAVACVCWTVSVPLVNKRYLLNQEESNSKEGKQTKKTNKETNKNQLPLLSWAFALTPLFFWYRHFLLVFLSSGEVLLECKVYILTLLFLIVFSWMEIIREAVANAPGDESERPIFMFRLFSSPWKNAERNRNLCLWSMPHSHYW